MVSYIVATTTLVVRATIIVDGEENRDATIKENDESGVLNGDQERNILFSSYDLHEMEEIAIDRIVNYTKEDTVGTTDDSKITEEPNGDASNKTSDPSLNDVETESAQKIRYIEVDDGINQLARKKLIEDMASSSSLSFSEKTTILKIEEVENKNDTEESIDNSLVEIKDEEIESTILSSLKNVTKEEGVQKDTVMGNITVTQEVKMEENEIPSITLSSSSENSTEPVSEKLKTKINMGDDITPHDMNLEGEEKPYSSSSSSSEKTTKLRPEGIEKKKDMEGGVNSPLVKEGSRSSNRSSDSSIINSKSEEIQKKAMMENEFFEKPVQSQDNTQKVEDKEKEEQSDNSINNASSSNAQVQSQDNTQKGEEEEEEEEQSDTLKNNTKSSGARVQSQDNTQKVEDKEGEEEQSGTSKNNTRSSDARVQSQDNTQKVEDKEEEEKQSDNSINNATSSDAQIQSQDNTQKVEDKKEEEEQSDTFKKIITSSDAQVQSQDNTQKVEDKEEKEEQSDTSKNNAILSDAQIQSQDNTKKVEDKENEEEQSETSKKNATSSDTQPNMRNETNTQDENASSFSKKTKIFPDYDDSNNNDDSIIDLDLDSEGSETRATEEKKEEEMEHDDENYLKSVIINNENKEDIISGVNDKARARAQARKDRRSIETDNTTASEAPTSVATDGYRGEPWGQYRPTRRLPDLELLRLVFENSNKTGNNRTSGDINSQKVVSNWRKDPLYDENMMIDAVTRGPLLVDEEDQKFLDYRSRLLDENDNGATGVNLNSKSKTGNEKTKEERYDKKINEINGNSNNVDVNSEFVEGLDDIANFFEGVDPPDELDVGYGSSIQDVLMDKGKHILLKKVRGVARWIRIGWQTMGRKLEARISQFHLPFQKIEGTINTSSDFDVGAANSSQSNGQRDRIVASTRDTIISAWKTGKQIFELISDLVDGLLDRFDGRSEDDSANFDDFKGFDLDNLSTFPPPS